LVTASNAVFELCNGGKEGLPVAAQPVTSKRAKIGKIARDFIASVFRSIAVTGGSFFSIISLSLAVQPALSV